MCAALRDIFGNPFRPVRAGPAWLTSTVVALARGIYEDRAFDRLPILADALMDAGCEHPDILAHCRSDGPHVRGCWVIDLLLGQIVGRVKARRRPGASHLRCVESAPSLDPTCGPNHDYHRQHC